MEQAPRITELLTRGRGTLTDEEQWEVAVAYMSLAQKVAGKHARQYAALGLDAEDLCQAGVIALKAAANGFDHTKGFAFATYAWACIGDAVWKEGIRLRPDAQWDRKTKRHTYLSIEAAADAPLGHAIEGRTATPSAEDEAMPGFVAATIQEAIDTLPTERQRQWVRRFYLNGETYQDIADNPGEGLGKHHINDPTWKPGQPTKGLSRQRVEQVLKEALGHLRESLEDRDLTPA